MQNESQKQTELSPEGLAVVARVQELMDMNRTNILKSVDERHAAADASLRAAIASVASNGATGVDLRQIVRDEVATLKPAPQVNLGEFARFATGPKAIHEAVQKASALEVSLLTRLGLSAGFQPAETSLSPAQAGAAIAAVLPGVIAEAKTEMGPAGEVVAVSLAGWLHDGVKKAHDAKLVQSPQAGISKWAAVALGLGGSAVIAGGVTLGVMAYKKTGPFAPTEG